MHYTVKIGEKKQEILKGVNGCANPGEFLAIMGSSGAGKTTLLNILAGRIQSSSSAKVSGAVKANGTDINSISFEKIAAYVTQDDILLPTLTVRESLTFSATIRCQGTKKEIDARVEHMIKNLRLERVADNIVGSVLLKGISGGERKRACIGIEIISDPSVIILDEPTSGLDSYTAEVLLDLLIAETRRGKTVLTTIHQPSTSIFSKIDKLILMCEGYTVYQGSANRSRRYFRKIGYRCPKHINPPDYYMRVLHIVNRYEKTELEEEKLANLTSQYSASLMDEDIPSLMLAKIDQYPVYSINFVSKIGLLWKRSYINARRSPVLSKVRVIQFVINAVIVDILFHDLGSNYKSIQNINGVLFFITIVMFQLVGNSSAVTFPVEKPTFIKEHSQGLYSTWIYFMSKSLSEMPMTIFTPLLFSIMTYFALDLNLTASKFFLFFIICSLQQMSAAGTGYITGALCPNEETAAAFAPLLGVIFMLYGGMYTNLDRMSVAFRWIQYISPYSWCFKALAKNQFDGMEIECSQGQECDPLKDLGFNAEL